jgi:L-iditol 2-dehydrogenase
MKVLRLHGKGSFELHDEAEPVPLLDEFQLTVSTVGICGSDLTWFRQGSIGDADLSSPLILGHEFAGIIASPDRRGERVAVDPAICCRNCRYCESGKPNLCENIRFAGHGGQDGALCEKLCWPKTFIYTLPDELTNSDGAMLEPLGVALHALDLGRVTPGMTVGVFGCGPIGLMMIQLAGAAGAGRIIATDPLPHRLDAAREFGASAIQATPDGEEWRQVWSETNRRGLDIAFEAACSSMAVETAIRSVRPGSHVILIGIPEDDRTGFTASIARRKALTLRLVRRMKHTYPRAIDLVKRKVVDVASLVTHRFALTDFQKAFDIAANREGLKVIIEPN